jgi:hypothetical protein
MNQESTDAKRSFTSGLFRELDADFGRFDGGAYLLFHALNSSVLSVPVGTILHSRWRFAGDGAILFRFGENVSPTQGKMTLLPELTDPLKAAILLHFKAAYSVPALASLWPKASIEATT